MVIDDNINLDYYSNEDSMAYPHQFRCCYICGSQQALWQLNSKPSTATDFIREPFFPFLQYQIKASMNASQLDAQGRCVVCNVCYLLLMQQWRSYENSNTPIVQRLYWMKRPPEEYKDILENSGTFFATNKLQSIVSQNTTDILPIVTSTVVSGDDTHPSPKTIEQEPQISNVAKFFSCYLCSCNDVSSSSCSVYTAPQQNKETPFFTGILQEKDKQNVHECGGDKVLLCKQCSSNLHRQWVEFEKCSVPYHERKYHIYIPSSLRGRTRYVACYLCSYTLTNEHRKGLCCQETSDQPFYPFIKNLYPPYNSTPIDPDGYTTSCRSCSFFLKRQWDIFDAAGIPQEERIYRIHPAQPPFVPSSLETDTPCILCRSPKPVSMLKRIYCNAGANMNIRLLISNFSEIRKDGFYNEETGETFICFQCFYTLREKWLNPLKTIKNVVSKKCSICGLSSNLCHDIECHQQTEIKEDSSLLSVLENYVADDETHVRVCKPCHANLLFQLGLGGKPFNDFKDRMKLKIESPTSESIELQQQQQQQHQQQEEEANERGRLTSESIELQQQQQQQHQQQQEEENERKRSTSDSIELQQQQQLRQQENEEAKRIKKRCGNIDVHLFTCYICGRDVYRVDIRFLKKEEALLINDDGTGAEVDDDVIVCSGCHNNHKESNTNEISGVINKEQNLDKREKEFENNKIVESCETSKGLGTKEKEEDKVELPEDLNEEQLNLNQQQQQLRLENEKASSNCDKEENQTRNPKQEKEETETVESVGFIVENTNKKSGEQEEPVMKATATVSPFLNFNMRSHHTQEQQHTSTNAATAPHESASEGSFAAALRKLAQQAPGFPSPVLPREQRYSPPLPGKGIKGDILSPMLIPPRISGATSILSPINPHHSPYLRPGDKQELLLKTSFGHLHSREHAHPATREHPSHPATNDSKLKPPNQPPIVPGVFQYSDREEHMRRQSQEMFEAHNRESYEQNHHNPTSSGGIMPLSSNSIKERPSGSIGLVHPQPARKHRDEDIIVKSSAMNSIRYSPRESVAVHPLSPTELSRYGTFVAHQRSHSHSSQQTSCPVHGHELGGHQHEERSSRPPPVLPFDPAAHTFHTLPGQHPRLREDLQYIRNRHAADRKEQHAPLPHHALEEDLRRRGLDYRGAFAGLPPHLLEHEQYRRHLLNGSHEHPPGFKESPHGQVYVPPHFYYGRDYPVPVDPYLPHGLPAQNELLHRYGPSISPRLMEPFRRGDHAAIERARNEYETERRMEERRQEKERNGMFRPPSIESLKKRHEEERRKQPNYTVSLDKKPTLESPKTKTHMPIFRGLECNNNNNNTVKPHKPNGTAHQANSINSLLSSKLPSSKSELDAASILANMNRINQSPCSDEVESLTSSSGTENHTLKPPVKIEASENTPVEPHQSDEKRSYLFTLGLVSHSRKRVLEDEYDRKRWDRKFRKFRGRPKKRSKRENTEDGSLNGDIRPASELDFYNGPMTRHKQQLLQEQENLLEQIQKRNSIDASETNSNEQIEQINTPENSQKTRQSPGNSMDNKTAERHDKNKSSWLPSEEHNLPNTSRKSTPTISMPSNSATTNTTISPQGVSSAEMRNSSEHSGRLMAMLRDNSPGQTGSSNTPSSSGTVASTLTRDQHMKRPAVNSNPFAHHVEEVKSLDNSLFGRPLEHPPDHYIRWHGVNYIHHVYTSYLKECDMQRQHLLQSYEELQRESRCLHQKRDFLEKDMLVYNERSMRIAEKRRNMQLALENINHTLHSISQL